MKKTVTHEWFYLLGFLIFGSAAFGLYYLAAERFASPESVTARFARPGVPDLKPVAPQGKNEKIFLAIDAPQALEGVTVIYRGRTGREMIRLDVILGELDPHRHYPYLLDIRSAKKSFSLDGRQYRLLDAGTTRLKMIRLSGKEPE